MCVRSHNLHRGFPPSFCSHLWLDNSFLWDAVLCIVGCWHPNLCSLSADNISGPHRYSKISNISLFLRVPQGPKYISWEELHAVSWSGHGHSQLRSIGRRDQWLAEWPWVELSTVFSCRLQKWELWRRGSSFSCSLWVTLATLLSLLLHFLSSLSETSG